MGTSIFAVMKRDPARWHETDEATFHEMLGAVPPAAMCPGAFLLGESLHHNAQGEAVYACFKQSGEVFEARHMTIAEFNQLKTVRG